ncbi:MAG: DUF4417 domain-containing protein [Christensenellaceae bacterium]
MELANRKRIRLEGFDYSSSGAYFMTICTYNREQILGDINVGQGLCSCRLSHIGRIVQDGIQNITNRYVGIKIIPNVQWGNEESYDFCFDGIPKESTIAISTNGCIKSSYDKFLFRSGLDKMIEVLSPNTIVVYSSMPESVFSAYVNQGIYIVNIENYNSTVRKKVEDNR